MKSIVVATDVAVKLIHDPTILKFSGTTASILYPLGTSENLCVFFFFFFRRYKMEILARNCSLRQTFIFQQKRKKDITLKSKTAN